MLLISTADAALYLCLSTTAINYMRSTGRLKPARVRPVRFALADLEALKIERSKQPRKLGRPKHGVEICGSV